MEFAVEKKKMLTALNFVSFLSNLSNEFSLCSIRVVDGKAIITWSDVANVIRINVDANDVVKEGSCCVNVFDLKNTVKCLNDGHILIRLSDEKLNLTSGTSFFCLSCIDKGSVTTPEKDEERFITEVKGDVVHHAIRNVIYVAGDKYDFLNIDIDGEKGQTLFVAVSEARLSLARIDIDYRGEGVNTVIPKSTARFLLNYSKINKEKNMQIFICKERSFGFRDDYIEYITKPVFVKFPNYRKILLNKDKSQSIIKVNIARSDFIDILKRSLVFLDQSYPSAVIEILPDGVVIVSSENERGSFSEKIMVDLLSNGSLKLAVNPMFIIQSLSNLTAEYVAIFFTGQKTALHVISDEDNCLSVIMPMAMKQ